MRIDALLSFVPIGTPLSLVGSDGVAIESNTIDLTGLGVGVLENNIIGTRTVFGTDFGIGDNRPLLDVVVGTGLVTGNSATLTVSLQGAIDDGTGNPGTWITFLETGQITAAQAPANTRIARMDIEAAFPEGTLPRFLRLQFAPAASTHFTAGTVKFAIVTTVRDDYSVAYAAKNYTVA